MQLSVTRIEITFYGAGVGPRRRGELPRATAARSHEQRQFVSDTTRSRDRTRCRKYLVNRRVIRTGEVAKFTSLNRQIGRNGKKEQTVPSNTPAGHTWPRKNRSINTRSQKLKFFYLWIEWIMERYLKNSIFLAYAINWKFCLKNSIFSSYNADRKISVLK